MLVLDLMDWWVAYNPMGKGPARTALKVMARTAAETGVMKRIGSCEGGKEESKVEIEKSGLSMEMWC